MSSSELTDPATIRANRSGEMTREQASSVKSKLGQTPSWFVLGIMAILIAAAAVVGGNILTKSTPLALGTLVVIILITFAITAWVGNIIGSGRMSGIIVEPAPGSVVWKGNAYVAEAGGRTLEPAGGGMDLQPGDYTFYVVHGKNWLLSAESAALAAQIDAPPDLDRLKALLERGIDFDPKASPELTARRAAELRQAVEQFRDLDPSKLTSSERDAFLSLSHRMAQQMGALMAGQGLQGMGQFVAAMEHAAPPLDAHGAAELNQALEQVGVMHPTALDTNRQGQQTGSQRSALVKGLGFNLLGAVVVLVVWLYLLYLGFVNHEVREMLAVGLFALLIELVLLGQARAELADWISGRALMEEGIVTKYTRSSYGRSHRTYYYFRVNHVQLGVSQAAYHALLEGPYRVYYAPATKTLLNIEPVQSKPG